MTRAMCTHAGVVSQAECPWCQIAQRDARIAAIQAESEGRRIALLSKAEELRMCGIRADKAEAQWDAVLESAGELKVELRRTAEMIDATRKRIADVLKGGVVYGNHPWEKGYCAGVTSALTAFDDGTREWKAQAEKALALAGEDKKTE